MGIKIGHGGHDPRTIMCTDHIAPLSSESRWEVEKVLKGTKRRKMYMVSVDMSLKLSCPKRVLDQGQL